MKSSIIPDGKAIQTQQRGGLPVIKGCNLCSLGEDARRDVRKRLDAGELTIVEVAAIHGMSVGKVLEHIYYHSVESVYLTPDSGMDYYIQSINGMIHRLQTWFLHVSESQYPDATNVQQLTNLTKEIRSCLQLMASIEGKIGGSKSMEDFATLQNKYKTTLTAIVDMVCPECRDEILAYIQENIE